MRKVAAFLLPLRLFAECTMNARPKKRKQDVLNACYVKVFIGHVLASKVLAASKLYETNLTKCVCLADCIKMRKSAKLMIIEGIQ